MLGRNKTMNSPVLWLWLVKLVIRHFTKHSEYYSLFMQPRLADDELCYESWYGIKTQPLTAVSVFLSSTAQTLNSLHLSWSWLLTDTDTKFHRFWWQLRLTLLWPLLVASSGMAGWCWLAAAGVVLMVTKPRQEQDLQTNPCSGDWLGWLVPGGGGLLECQGLKSVCQD